MDDKYKINELFNGIDLYIHAIKDDKDALTTAVGDSDGETDIWTDWIVDDLQRKLFG